MAVFQESKYFVRKSVTPGSLIPDNLISFSYRSPKGVHDKSPLVLVLEARQDRLFGINLHYGMSQMDELLGNQIAKFTAAIEKEWYKKYPAKRTELRKNGQVFDVGMVTKADMPALARRVNRIALETFPIDEKDIAGGLRCYLYSRMTRVSKLVWRT